MDDEIIKYPRVFCGYIPHSDYTCFVLGYTTAAGTAAQNQERPLH